jgi:Holliday junction resolvase
MRKYGRVDTNHAEIVQALRGIGASVVSLASVGCGAPDLAVGLRGETFLLEVKTPKGKMTADEMRFMVEWKGHYMIVRTVEQAIDAVTNPAARRVEMEF